MWRVRVTMSWPVRWRRLRARQSIDEPDRASAIMCGELESVLLIPPRSGLPALFGLWRGVLGSKGLVDLDKHGFTISKGNSRRRWGL
jgi:hypothetical protein